MHLIHVFTVFLLCLFPLSPLSAQESDLLNEEQGDVLFKAQQWENRIVVITGSPSNPVVDLQLDLFRENLEGLQARDIALVRFLNGNIYELSDFTRNNFKARFDMNADQQGYLEDQMQSDNDIFSIVLIGKDGYWKRTWKGQTVDGIYEPLETPVSPAAIFRVIDSMPMRQREMNEKKR